VLHLLFLRSICLTIFPFSDSPIPSPAAASRITEP
jgi:hypothetical protein